MMEGEDDNGSQSFDQKQAQCKVDGSLFLVFLILELSERKVRFDDAILKKRLPFSSLTQCFSNYANSKNEH